MTTDMRQQNVGAVVLQPAGSILALGVEVNALRACLLEEISGSYRLAAWSNVPRRAEVGLAEQSGDLLQRLGQRLHRQLWNPAERNPLVASEDGVRQPPLEHVSVTASPRPHVRVWLAGLAPTRSMAAAQEALTGSPAHIIGHTAYTADLQIGALADSLAIAAPEMVVIAGGFDNAEVAGQEPLLELCRIFGQALARSAPSQRPAVVFAGNRWVAPRAVELLQAASGATVEAVENVQPAPGRIYRAALAQAVSFYYWRLCRRTAGFREISRWATSPGHISSLETSFAQLVQVWMELHDLPELHGLYCGPAWWLHVCTGRSQSGANLCYVEPGTRPEALENWPALQLVSGEWPVQLWPQPRQYWWDRSGFAATVATAGQVAPQAMLQVMSADLLEFRRKGEGDVAGVGAFQPEIRQVRAVSAHTTARR